MKLHAILEAKYHRETADGIDLANPPRGIPYKEFERVVNDNWPHGVLYKGEKVFELVYMNRRNNNALESYLKKINAHVRRFESQESYLGYDAASDRFMMGWDTWGESDHDDYDYDEDDDEYREEEVPDTINVVAFTLDGDVITDMRPVDTGSNMMYGQNSALDALHHEFDQLIDVRLD